MYIYYLLIYIYVYLCVLYIFTYTHVYVYTVHLEPPSSHEKHTWKDVKSKGEHLICDRPKVTNSSEICFFFAALLRNALKSITPQWPDPFFIHQLGQKRSCCTRTSWFSPRRSFGSSNCSS